MAAIISRAPPALSLSRKARKAERSGARRAMGRAVPVVLVQIRGPISPASPVRHLYKPVPSITPWRRGAAPAPLAGGARGGGAFEHLAAVAGAGHRPRPAVVRRGRHLADRARAPVARRPVVCVARRATCGIGAGGKR